MYINRKYERTDADDYNLNIQPILDGDKTKEVVIIFHPTENYIVGWKIQKLYE